MNCLQMLTVAYKLAAAESYRQLVTGLDPETTQDLRLPPNRIGPEPSIFYIPSKEAVILAQIADEKLVFAEALLLKRKPKIIN